MLSFFYLQPKHKVLRPISMDSYGVMGLATHLDTTSVLMPDIHAWARLAKDGDAIKINRELFVVALDLAKFEKADYPQPYLPA